MNNLKHLFVPYKLAVIAKQKGFYEPCLKSITETGFENDYSILGAKNWNEIEGVVSIPLYQQLVDWLNKEHELVVRLSYDGDGYDLFTAHDSEREGKWFQTQDKAIEQAFKLI